MDRIPEEITLAILTQIPSADLLSSAMQVSRRLRRLALTELLFRAEIQISNSGRYMLPVTRPALKLVPFIPPPVELFLTLDFDNKFELHSLTNVLSTLDKVADSSFTTNYSYKGPIDWSHIINMTKLLQVYIPDASKPVLILERNGFRVSRPRRMKRFWRPWACPDDWAEYGMDSNELPLRAFFESCAAWITAGVHTNSLLLLPVLLVALSTAATIQFTVNIGASLWQYTGSAMRSQYRRIADDLGSKVNKLGIMEMDINCHYSSKVLVLNNEGMEKLILGPVSPHLTPTKMLEILDTQDLLGLKDLVIEDDLNLEFLMFILFLSKHPSIEYLDLGHRSLSQSSNTWNMVVPDGIFINLKSLSGPASYIITLLLHSHLFPRIDSVFIDATSLVSSWLPSIIAPASFQQLDEALQAVACLDPQPSHLGLILPGRSIQNWLRRKDSEGSAERSLHGVSHLTLSVKPGESFSQDVLEALARWIELFPSLKQPSNKGDAGGARKKRKNFIVIVYRFDGHRSQFGEHCEEPWAILLADHPGSDSEALKPQGRSFNEGLESINVQYFFGQQGQMAERCKRVMSKEMCFVTNLDRIVPSHGQILKVIDENW
ncbi:hypothetical protein C8J56DRAFT_888642 [Mycena floridula]|nr:hypothetical protein C8J56DRAFT_888642 [Mycena floridula]